MNPRPPDLPDTPLYVIGGKSASVLIRTAPYESGAPARLSYLGCKRKGEHPLLSSVLITPH